MTPLIRSLAILAVIYAATLAGGLLLLVILTRSPLWGTLHIVFYRGVLLSIVAALVSGIFLMIASRRWPAIDLATGIGALATSLAFNLCFLVLIPVTIDRSLTIFLLSRIDAERTISEADLRDRFVREYVGDMQQIRRRMAEQTLSGNVMRDDKGRIALTPRGRSFIKRMRQIADFWGTDQRFVEADAPRQPERRPDRCAMERNCQ